MSEWHNLAPMFTRCKYSLPAGAKKQIRSHLMVVFDSVDANPLPLPEMSERNHCLGKEI